MSENKPNDEPKLSTTDRVVKCKSGFCLSVRRGGSGSGKGVGGTLEGLTAGAAPNASGGGSRLRRRKKGVSRALTAQLGSVG